MLNIKDLTKKIHDKNILNHLSLSINSGEIAVLLGSSGVGKSTLLRILNNLETIDTGTIELDGKVLDLNTVNQNHTIGMVFQHFNLFEHLTVEQNIALALEHVAHKNKQEAHTIALELLHTYNLADKAQHMVSQLSGGQKQRLALARTLALKPRIICLDEPTSALDPLLTTNVATTIQELAQQGYLVLVATHDIHLLEKLSCTIHLMHNGSIIESANSQEFFAEKNKYPHIAAFVTGA
ncbi:MAG TPA: ATP-binding cassette domain-containing protein [Candidatus Dependentiae bacterium]|nr:ATP-binding cassette domain-containing protein [Candidatus Dependentiae bacterium]HRQ62903.1 ATP-binding cassette domain-containing protein [Candidatus Dependentiae bacterium]